jgi:amidase
MSRRARVCCIVLVALAAGCKESPAPVHGGGGAGGGGGGLTGLAAEVAELSLAELEQRLASGTLTARALTQAYLDRIAALDDAGPTLNAVIEVNPDALRDADARDAERTAGKVRGPLHGVPVLLKDNIDAAGMANSAGSLALADHRPAKDAFLVARLRDAGAVILGKTNLSEWANFRSTHSISGWSSRGGQTRSPYALDRNPCGSSAGTGAAIAASLAAVGVGTETDGSIICPASVSGLVGLKPTVGLVSRGGIIPISISQDTAGPMGRTVADVAALLAVLAAPDPRDPAAAAGGEGDGDGDGDADYRAALRADALSGKRFGVLRKSMGYLPAVDAATEVAIAALKAAGAEVIDVELATAGQWDGAELEVLLYEFKDGLDRYLRDSGAPLASLAAVIEWNRAHAATAMPHFAQELFEMAQAKGPLTDAAYVKARDDARRLARTEGLEATLAQHQLDALIAPAVGPSWLTDPVLGDHFTGAGYGVAAVAGTPSITVPMGDDRGLPLGLVFMGPAYSEAALLGYAYAFEQATRARTAPTYAPTLAR